MRFETVRFIFKKILSSTGFFYILIMVLALLVVDFKTMDSRVKMRRLNDAKPEMGALIAFEEAALSSKKIDWDPYLRYFSMIVRYMPDEKISRMFLGVCEYQAGDVQKTAWSNIQRAAETPPYIFWDMYNAGALALERGDLRTAARYLERSLVLGNDMFEKAIRDSTVYRQIMAASDHDLNITDKIKRARVNVHLLLAAAYFYAKDHEKALSVARYSLEKMDVKEKEPFYFFAGAASMSLGKLQEAVFFLSKCVELKSTNPYVYRYMSDILKASGRNAEAENALRMAAVLQATQTSVFPYPDRLRLRFF